MDVVRHRLLPALLGLALVVSGCGAPSAPSATGPATGTAAAAKVLLIVEENEGYDRVIGSPHAPYLAGLARQYGLATGLDAGYPVECPSLAAYLILTSGSDHGICDDDPPARHPIGGDDVFGQVDRSGRQWRSYAEAMPAPCTLDDAGETFLVRHVPVSYYVAERSRCAQWDVPLGTPDVGALHDDLAGGRLPALGVVTPDACDDMHGAGTCPDGLVARGDAWLARWMPLVLASPDWRSGALTVIITWDEGSGSSNHIPTIVVSPTTRGVEDATPRTHCSTLRTVADLLGLPPLGCAAGAASMVAAFHLRAART